MKKITSLVLCVALSVGMLAGCGCGSSYQSDVSAISVRDDGSILAVSVEELDQSYYDEEELKTYIDDAVSEYTSANEDVTVKVQSLKVSDSVATLNMKYDSAQTYSDFNGVTLFTGTVAEALAAGYEFDCSFASISDGASSDASAASYSAYLSSISGDASSDASESADATGDVSMGDADTADVTDALDANVVIVSEQVRVNVPGTITFVSADGARVTSTDTVDVNNRTESLTYVIYQ
ncbi:MAG: hypothetical protein K5840_01795 [Eubacterium sp.]|nr:hypothetical protein [Eubacterium sp.]